MFYYNCIKDHKVQTGNPIFLSKFAENTSAVAAKLQFFKKYAIQRKQVYGNRLSTRLTRDTDFNISLWDWSAEKVVQNLKTSESCLLIDRIENFCRRVKRNTALAVTASIIQLLIALDFMSKNEGSFSSIC